MSDLLFTGKERRDYVRLDAALQVRFTLGDDASAKTYEGETKNISHGGACVSVMQDISELVEKLSSKGSTVKIDLTLEEESKTGSSEGPISVGGTIDWVKKPAQNSPELMLGVSFVKMEGNARDRIHGYVVNEFIRNYGKTI